ncbi:PREDICTED: proline and serine-rich protein 3-like [Amphimedon queenslandica]|uniref:Uncharacterized protein n=1 Tax=Amphimedon queenslandica TaxID=400682 RepID=A0A1X7UZH8_AMPQE|nr:PREDICTED: proline and serine-rich protein 3-like [Amphimedon queenslandica]|eukprot:XP_019851524.1 PREDICTED: proline and serine-rich protein 3-like [Amphimedon queenslandica]
MADHSSFSSSSSNDTSSKRDPYQLQSWTDQSDSSTFYEESWPHVATPPVHVVTMETSDTRPVIARYIHRFRTTPPTSREGRSRDTDGQFWWKKKEKMNQPIRVDQESNTKAARSVSRDESLKERAGIALEKSSSLLSARSQSHEDQLTFKTRTHSLHLFTEPLSEVSLSDDDATQDETHLKIKRNDDILYQWRLNRRLEEARRDVAAAKRERQRKEIIEQSNKENYSLSRLHNMQPSCHKNCTLPVSASRGGGHCGPLVQLEREERRREGESDGGQLEELHDDSFDSSLSSFSSSVACSERPLAQRKDIDKLLSETIKARLFV